MIMQKEQVNLGSIERSHVGETISYILLIIASDYDKVSKSTENILPRAISRPGCQNIFFIYFNFSQNWQAGLKPNIALVRG